MAGATRLLLAYLVVGPDELKRKQTVTRLRAHVEGPFADFNLEELVASADMEPVGVLSSLNTLPMGGDLRVVIIENAGKLPKPVSEAVIEYLKAPNESCTLLLVAETLAKSTRLYKAVAKVGPRSVIECGAPKRRDLTPYVQKLAAAHGVGIDADAASELVSRVGESTTMLDNQLSALSALLGGQGQLTRAFVEQNVARTAEVKPWEFLDRIAERDARRSFELLALLRGNSAIGLLSLVTGRIRELICARALMARGDARGIAAALGKADWQVRGHARAFWWSVPAPTAPSRLVRTPTPPWPSSWRTSAASARHGFGGCPPRPPGRASRQDTNRLNTKRAPTKVGAPRSHFVAEAT